MNEIHNIAEGSAVRKTKPSNEANLTLTQLAAKTGESSTT